MQCRKLLSVTRAILRQPTAPFYEALVAAEITRLLRSCPHVSVERDKFGNLIAHYARGKRRPEFAFAAHMDHPGWVGERFLGGVPESYLRDPKTQSFGDFAMWDLPPFVVENDLLHSRACDDLIGCAAIVAMFHELERMKVETSCLGLFTRAEEVGFLGAIALAKSRIIPKSIAIISLETSAERPPARIGDGPIIRVGDRTSIFSPSVTARLECIAAESGQRVQRCLMPGGTCEATAYQLYGYKSGALCVALGNYHNCAPGNKIDAEFVSLGDYIGLVNLCVKIASSVSNSVDPSRALRRKLEQNAGKFRVELTRSRG
jgi:putative aminopeptidase FrvX